MTLDEPTLTACEAGPTISRMEAFAILAPRGWCFNPTWWRQIKESAAQGDYHANWILEQAKR